MNTQTKPPRKEQILHTLLQQLMKRPEQITTKSLAAELGMTESALYRHFASKRQMFVALIAHIDAYLDAQVYEIMAQGENYVDMLHDLAQAYLLLMQSNQGYARIVSIVYLEREDKQLVADMLAVLHKYEGAFRHIMRDMEHHTSVRVAVQHTEASALLLSCLQGIVLRSLYTSDKTTPLQQFAVYWQQLTQTLFVT